MPLETATFIDELNSSNPASGDGLAQADDHLRLIKAVLQATFPNFTAALTATEAELDAVVASLAAGITTAQIGALQVTAAKLAADAVETAKIKDLNVTTGKLNDLAVTEGKLAALAVAEAKIAAGAVTTTKLGDLAVSAAKLAADAVTTVKILDANVTNAKIADATIEAAKLTAAAKAVLNPFGAALLHVQDQKAQGTAAQTLTINTWNTRELNTEVTDEIGATLGSNIITLPAGTYWVEAESSFALQAINRQWLAKLRLYNVSDAAEIDIKSIAVGGITGAAEQVCTVSPALLKGRFTIAAEKNLRLDMYAHCVTGGATFSQGGRPVSQGVELYTDIKFFKLA